MYTENENMERHQHRLAQVQAEQPTNRMFCVCEWGFKEANHCRRYRLPHSLSRQWRSESFVVSYIVIVTVSPCNWDAVRNMWHAVMWKNHNDNTIKCLYLFILACYLHVFFAHRVCVYGVCGSEEMSDQSVRRLKCHEIVEDTARVYSQWIGAIYSFQYRVWRSQTICYFRRHRLSIERAAIAGVGLSSLHCFEYLIEIEWFLSSHSQAARNILTLPPSTLCCNMWNGPTKTQLNTSAQKKKKKKYAKSAVSMDGKLCRMKRGRTKWDKWNHVKSRDKNTICSSSFFLSHTEHTHHTLHYLCSLLFLAVIFVNQIRTKSIESMMMMCFVVYVLRLSMSNCCCRKSLVIAPRFLVYQLLLLFWESINFRLSIKILEIRNMIHDAISATTHDWKRKKMRRESISNSNTRRCGGCRMERANRKKLTFAWNNENYQMTVAVLSSFNCFVSEACIKRKIISTFWFVFVRVSGVCHQHANLDNCLQFNLRIDWISSIPLHSELIISIIQ